MAKLSQAAGAMCALGLSFSMPACHPRCSDGFVEVECEPESPDEALTPGDDRAGYLACTSSGAFADTCGPGSGCCGDGSRCAADAGQCDSPDWFSTCDGPEDCAEGEQCWLDDRTIRCSAEATPELYVRCHTDDDCESSAQNPCVSGYCLGVPKAVEPRITG